MYKINIKILFCLILILCSVPVFSFSPVNAGEETFRKIDDISRQVWQNSVPDHVENSLEKRYLYDSPLKTDRYLAVTVHNTTGRERWCLEFQSQFELVEIFYFSRIRNSWVSLYSGDQIPMNRRDLPHPSLIIPLELSDASETDLFIHVQDYQEKSITVRLVSPEMFLLQAGKRNGFLYFSFSFIIIVALYHFFLYLAGRKQFYLYYALVMICLVITLLGKQRIFSYIFLPGRPYGYFIYLFFNSLAILFSLLFSKAFFRISGRGREGRILTGFIALFVLITAFSLIRPTPVLGDIMNLLIIPALVYILYFIFRKSFKGDRVSRLVLLSFLPLVTGGLLDNLFAYTDFLSSSRQGLLLVTGTMIHALIMSYSMAMRQADLDLRYTALRKTFHSHVDRSVKARTEELQNTVYRDPLTGLLNRACMLDKIQEIENNYREELSILFADLDNFKYYNDNFGHPAGDRILEDFSRFLMTHLRSDDLIFRYGGDEFLILMPSTPSEPARQLSRRLHEEFQNLVEKISRELSEKECLLGLSLGFASWHPGSSLMDAVNKADQALLTAKEQGKNRICIYQ